MKKVDPKYINVPNICFSVTDKNDEREINFKKERLEFGFDESETWSLDITIAKFIVPRLEHYQKIAKIILVRDEQLIKDIDDFLLAMKLKSSGDIFYNNEELNLIRIGLEKFPKIFNSLWW